MPKASEGERARVLHEPSEQIETVCSSCNRQPYDRDLYFSHDDVLYATPEIPVVRIMCRESLTISHCHHKTNFINVISLQECPSTKLAT